MRPVLKWGGLPWSTAYIEPELTNLELCRR